MQAQETDDMVPDSPLPIKRRRVNISSDGNTSDSTSDSDANPFADHETVETVPVHHNPPKQGSGSPSQHHTQPTQIIDLTKSEHQKSARPFVQVTASSPLKSSPSARTRPAGGGVLASVMAPPGTAFRPPRAPQPTKQILDLDERPTYRGGSSSEDEQGRNPADIRQSIFTRGGRNAKAERIPESPVKQNPPFKPGEITRRFAYQPTPNDSASLKRSADIMANAYGGSTRPQKLPRQPGQVPRAKPAPPQDKTLDDVQDFSLRKKIEAMQQVASWASVLLCEAALVTKKGNFEDAMDYLTSSRENARMDTKPTGPVDLTVSDHSDDELSGSKTVKSPKRTAKQQIRVPARSIQQKWSSTQATTQATAQATAQRSLIKTTVNKAAAPQPRRRLVQGRKRTPPLPSPPQPAVESPSVESPTALSSGSDSEAEIPDAEPDADVKVRDFINSCSAKELADLTSINEADAEYIISQRPFESLDGIYAVRIKKKTGKGGGRAIGERVVEKCQDMWRGYDAVDQLVRECETKGKPIAETMKKWGVDIFGKEELDMVNLEAIHPRNDTGLITPADDDNVRPERSRIDKSEAVSFVSQPRMMSDNILLKDYQIVGINWLSLLFKHKLSCILADDMGLGKTAQVIGFIAHLSEVGVKGPHLVVVPPATIENWLREFRVFCPKLKVEPYHGPLAERPDMRLNIEVNDDIDVVVTTYGMAKQKDDLKWLRRRSFCVCVFDEGHQLKNSKSVAYQNLIKIPAQLRLLLTGTPLQNNLKELISLLAFIMPQLFAERREDLEFIFSHRIRTSDKNHDALLSAQRVERAKLMLKPFVLRRKKHQVLSSLPKKIHRVEFCELNAQQKRIYDGELETVKSIIEDKMKVGQKAGSSTNVVQKLRFAAIHPLLSRQIYNDERLHEMVWACLKDEQWKDSNPEFLFEDMTVMTDMELHRMCESSKSLQRFVLPNEEWMDSGKVAKLCELLIEFTQNGDRTLVFSQFKLVLDILDYVMETLGIKFFRLDGDTRVEERQEMIDQFYEDTSISAFMISTKAGGTGINLACANKVIIFDMSFNPQDDIQAENRAHRVGSTRDVEVIRLVTRGTVEEQMFKMGESKIKLDERVAGFEELGDEEKEGSSSSSSSSSTTTTTKKAKNAEPDAEASEEAEKEGERLVLSAVLEGKTVLDY